MFKHKMWLTAVSAGLILLFFLSIFWDMRQVAVYEQAQLQQEFQGIQIKIADQVTKGYEKGSSVVMALKRDSVEQNQNISLHLIDQLVTGMSSQEALTSMSTFLKGSQSKYVLYSQDLNKTLDVSEDAPTGITRDVLADWTRGLVKGKSISKSAYMMKLANADVRPRLILYQFRSQPWVICIQLNENTEAQSMRLTAQLIKDRFSKLSKNMTSDLIYIDEKAVVKRSSRPGLIGMHMALGPKVALSHEQMALLDSKKHPTVEVVNTDYVWIDLKDEQGKTQKYIGRYMWSDIEKCYFVTDARLFSEENIVIGRYLGVGVMINVLIALVLVKLVAQNYEYFVEGRQKVGQELVHPAQKVNRDQHRLGFIIMAIFLVEIVGLIQGIFSSQAIKFELERKLEVDSQQLLQQFKSSFDMTEDIQSFLEQFNTHQVDAGLIQCFNELDALLVVPEFSSKLPTNYFANDYRVFIRPVNKETLSMINGRFALSQRDLKPYKIMTYETLQDSKAATDSRMLIGLSTNQKWLIEIDFDQRKSDGSVTLAQKEMTNILSNAYYFNENTGNFYVFNANGKVKYQGGFEKNAQYFGERDLNSSQTLFDLVKTNQDTGMRVIYQAGEKTNRSLIYANYDAVEDEYYVYEQDQAKRFLDIDRIYKFIWILGIGLLLVTFGIVWLVWERVKHVREEDALVADLYNEEQS